MVEMNQKIYDYLKKHDLEFIDYWVSEYYIYSNEHTLRASEKDYLIEYRKECLFLFHANLDTQMQKTDLSGICQGIGEDRAAMSTPFKEVYFNFFDYSKAMLEFLIQHKKEEKIAVSYEELLEYMLLVRKHETENSYAIYSGYMDYTFKAVL